MPNYPTLWMEMSKHRRSKTRIRQFCPSRGKRTPKKSPSPIRANSGVWHHICCQTADLKWRGQPTTDPRGTSGAGGWDIEEVKRRSIAPNSGQTHESPPCEKTHTNKKRRGRAVSCPQRETKCIHKLKAINWPGLNEIISFKPFL